MCEHKKNSKPESLKGEHQVDNIVRRIIFDNVWYCEIDDNDMKDETTFDELGADLLDHVGILMGLEEHFDCQIDDDIGMNWKTVGEVVGYCKQFVNA